MEATLLIVAGLLLFVTIFAAGCALFAEKRNLMRPVQAETVGTRPSVGRRLLARSERVLKPLGQLIPRPAEEMSKQELRLVQAGIRRKDARPLFYGTQVGLALACIAAFAVTGYLASNIFLFLVLSVFLGALIPDAWLRSRTASRKDRLQLALPDALDLMVVCVEAGLGLDQTIVRIGEEIRGAHKDLSDEFRLYNMEVNAGRSRVDALRNLARRTGLEDLRSLVAVLIQTDRFGTSIAHSLRVFSESMRVKRRQRAEERAAKMAVKMTVPMVFFVFPTIFIVVLGPGIIRTIRDFFPIINQ
ncbi:MAG: type II secretion system F family protein [Acidobacteria bacterium]|nr:MAG: type II secretion system F family protein [Acidobacteriota bacterium]